MARLGKTNARMAAAGLLAGLLAAAELVLASAGLARAAEPEIAGLWLTEKGKVAVDLFPCEEGLCGRVAWLARPHDHGGALRLDARNPDPGLRGRPWCGLTVITGLERRGPGLWEGGSFYYPKHGRSYDLAIEANGDQLAVHAWLGIRLLGRSETWTRADPALAGCPAVDRAGQGSGGSAG